MRAGSLRHRITLRAYTQTQDDAGQVVPAWATVATVWGDVRFLAGLEAIRAGGETQITRASIRIRWRAGIDSGMQVIHDGKTYEIKSALPDPTGRRHIDMIAETAVPHG